MIKRRIAMDSADSDKLKRWVVSSKQNGKGILLGFSIKGIKKYLKGVE